MKFDLGRVQFKKSCSNKVQQKYIPILNNNILSYFILGM